jgi:hypothetical protein
MLLILLVLILRLVITVSTPLFLLIHELAHAIPALLFEKNKCASNLGVGRFDRKLHTWAAAVRTQAASVGIVEGPAMKETGIRFSGDRDHRNCTCGQFGNLNRGGVPMVGSPSLPLAMHLMLAGCWLANTSIALGAMNPFSKRPSAGMERPGIR